MPFFSVIIPVYNKEKYIANTLNSVLKQDFSDFEIILIDDGSTDRSIDIALTIKDSRIKIVRQQNSGVAVARNKGAAMAQGKILAFLDADDIWLPEHLSELKNLADQFEDTDFFATAYQILYNSKLSKDYVCKFDNRRVKVKPYYRYNQSFPLFFTSNFAVTKDLFSRTGGFNPNIHAEDTEFFLRLGINNPLAYSQKITMIHIDKADNSLFASYQIDKKTAILKDFEPFEQTDPFLKKFLDTNRYVWALEYKMMKQYESARRLIQEIDQSHLNKKQVLLLRLPGEVLLGLKKLQSRLLSFGIRLKVQ